MMESATTPPTEPRPGPILRLYRWVLHWAYTPYGPRALAGLSFAESSFFPLPPDPLLLALALGRPKRAFAFAAIATGASVLGGILAYTIGAAAWGALEGFFFSHWVPGVTPESFASVQEFYERWDFWAVFLAGLTPFPYKVVTLSAGVFQINPVVFVVSSVLSRGMRFFVLAGLVYRWGEPIAEFIERRFALLTWAFGALVLLGFMAIRWIL